MATSELTAKNVVNVNVAASDEEDNEDKQFSNSVSPKELNKAPRLPRWSRQEIFVLIKGKRVAEGRVKRGRAATGAIEPKWAAVSAYCRRHGVIRGPVQCRKRWSNLFGDFKKIKDWELQEEKTDSFWLMRNDLRRERRLPGFFDREVYNILDGAVSLPLLEDDGPQSENPLAIVEIKSPEEKGEFELLPIAESQPATSSARGVNLGDDDARGCDSESHKGKRKRRSVSSDGEDEEVNWQKQLVEVLEKNGKMVAAHLEAQNMNMRLDREQRKDFSMSLIAVLSKLADAITKFAGKI